MNVSRLFALFLAFLRGIFGLRRRPALAPVRKRRPRRNRVTKPKADTAKAGAKRRSSGRAGPEGLVSRLADQLPTVPLPDGAWDPREAVSVEDGRVCLDLHGLSDEDAVAMVEEAFDTLAGSESVAVRLITGHGRDRPLGYSRIRVALVDALADRDDVTIDALARHRRHAESDDRLGHMDVELG